MCILIIVYQHSSQKKEKEVYEQYQRKLCKELVYESLCDCLNAVPNKKRQIMEDEKLMDSMIEEMVLACKYRDVLVDVADDIVYPKIEQFLREQSIS